ncbi:hypothetical protein D3H55_13930 [Bacillus salacetis]|uniref:Uncharacterized protein n=1 Tax=Bacillus salacetis TaxID=2315464 RepID=A0A3A1QUX7_9BACI|nr:hypothetical protein D3H55_13930 [Bacillus salacetis]
MLFGKALYSQKKEQFYSYLLAGVFFREFSRRLCEFYIEWEQSICKESLKGHTKIEAANKPKSLQLFYWIFFNFFTIN